MRDFLNAYQKLEFDKVKKYIQRYTISDIGREHVDKLIPSSSPEEVNANLANVSEMKLLLESDDPLPLENIFDIRTSLHRATIEDYILSAAELNRIVLVLKTSKALSVYFARRAQAYPLLSARVKLIRMQNIIEYNIRRAIDEDGKIKDSASKELASIRRQMSEKRGMLKKGLESMLKAVAGKEWVQDEIITTRDGRMVIPVKVEHKNRVPGFIHSSSASGATVFIEPTETLELNNDICTLQFQEQREIDKILKELTEQVRGAKAEILQNLQILAEIDFIHAKAKYSIEILGSAPALKLQGSFQLKKAYHPILLQKHSRKETVPLDIEFTDQFNTLVITGPNAGGKSVAMKTVGLLLIMAQAGCHIPASSESEIRIFSEIFVDMGDEQSIEDDLSSFSSHLKNLNLILENARNTSLILIDEIGSGTDPLEGSSLAASVLECLTTIGALNIVTTHHGTLKTFAYENSRIQNGAMEFDQATLRPTYRFRAGIPGSSYAIEMAERMNMPAAIIKRSRELKGSSANKLENLIVDLEKQSQDLKKKLDIVNEEKGRLDGLNLIYQNRVKTLEKELKEIKLKAINEAKFIVEKANAIVEKSVREIKENAADKQVIKKAKEELKTAVREFNTMKEEISAPPEMVEFQVGEHVALKESNTLGEITSIAGENHYMVLVGGLRVRIKRQDLEHAPSANVKRPVSSSTIQVQSSQVKREIDLRGMYGDEAINAVDKFLDDAILAGLHRIDIIHGKGTGALRKKITEHLKTNSTVKSFRLGEWNEGGSGVTIVELE